MDDKKAYKVAEKIFIVCDDFRSIQKARKRSYNDERESRSQDSKKSRLKSEDSRYEKDLKNSKDSTELKEPQMSSDQVKKIYLQAYILKN